MVEIGHWLVRMGWRPVGWSVCLPLLISPCTIKSRRSLLAPAHPGGPKKGRKMVVVVVTWKANYILRMASIQITWKGLKFTFWSCQLDWNMQIKFQIRPVLYWCFQYHSKFCFDWKIALTAWCYLKNTCKFRLKPKHLQPRQMSQTQKPTAAKTRLIQLPLRTSSQ